MLGLRVAGQGGSPPGIVRGLLRAAIFALPAHVLSRVLNDAFVERVATPSAGSASTTAILTAAGFAVSMSCLALLFSTARRRNGYAALHDLGSGTRVVVTRRAIESRHAAAAPAIRSGRPGGRRQPHRAVCGSRSGADGRALRGSRDRRRVRRSIAPEGVD